MKIFGFDSLSGLTEDSVWRRSPKWNDFDRSTGFFVPVFLFHAGG